MLAAGDEPAPVKPFAAAGAAATSNALLAPDRPPLLTVMPLAPNATGTVVAAGMLTWMRGWSVSIAARSVGRDDVPLGLRLAHGDGQVQGLLHRTV